MNHIDERLSAIKESQTRSRVVFIIAVVLSLGFILSMYNSYFSWYRQFAHRELDGAETGVGFLQRALLDDWMDSRSYTLPVVGVKIQPSDMSLVGGVALAITGIWFFYAMRRENHNVYFLLRGTRTSEDLDLRRSIFHTITARFLFSTVTTKNTAYSQFEKSDRPSEGEALEQEPGMRRELKLLFFLPAIAISAAIIVDCITYFWESPFRGRAPVKDGDESHVIQFVVTTFAGLGCAIVNGFFCARSLRFELATGKLLRDYYKSIEDDEKAA